MLELTRNHQKFSVQVSIFWNLQTSDLDPVQTRGIILQHEYVYNKFYI